MLKNPTIVVGPPGTGKTSFLINKAAAVIADGCSPDQVCYVSFTRQAVQEARERISAVTGYHYSEFIGFRTLHSMAYWLLGLSTADVVTDEEMLEACKETLPDSVFLKARYRAYAHLYSYSRVTGTSFSATWDKLHTEYIGTEEDFLFWIKTYQNYKTTTGKVDFMDIVQKFNEQKLQFPFRYFFVDEAQDFTPDQWAGVALLSQWSDRIFVAGDSDQAIYEWAGANGDMFDSLQGRKIILDQSKRVPVAPWRLAKQVLGAMGRDILYKPTERQGDMSWIQAEQVESLPFDNGETWYLLVRNRHHLKHLQSLLYRRGIYYKELGSSHGAADKGEDRYLKRIKWYEALLEGHEIRPYIRNKLSDIVIDLEESIGNQEPWYEAFKGWPIARIRYYRTTRSQWGDPKVHIGTFHSSKGAEADNVVLYGNCTRRVAELYRTNSLAELKVLYVAITRTKKHLYLLESTERNHIPWYRFLNPLILKLSSKQSLGHTSE
jgi:DNA helicase II / ATP-dependent DNA helicase PcrA